MLFSNIFQNNFHPDIQNDFSESRYCLKIGFLINITCHIKYILLDFFYITDLELFFHRKDTIFDKTKIHVQWWQTTIWFHQKKKLYFFCRRACEIRFVFSLDVMISSISTVPLTKRAPIFRIVELRTQPNSNQLQISTFFWKRAYNI